MKKLKKILSLLLVLILILGCALTGKWEASAKTKKLFTSLIQKSNPYYKDRAKEGMAVAYKVKLKSKTIIIHGSLSDFNGGETTNIGVHTYKLSSEVKYIARGGEAPDQEFSKKDFKKYLKKVKDSSLGLVLEFKKSKVSKVIISS